MGKSREPKMSDICGTCSGTGTVQVKRLDVARAGKESAGRTVLVTEKCPQCNGYGEYPTL